MSATWKPHGFRSQKEPRLAGTGSLRIFPSFPAYFSTGRRLGGCLATCLHSIGKLLPEINSCNTRFFGKFRWTILE